MSSGSVKRKSGLTFVYILSRLQVGLQKSCETGDNSHWGERHPRYPQQVPGKFRIVLLRKCANESQPPNLHLPHAALEDANVADISCGPAPALLSAAAKGNTSIFALFGRQGNNEVYFDELQSLDGIYKSYVAPLISTVTDKVLKTSCIHTRGYIILHPLIWIICVSSNINVRQKSERDHELKY